MLVKDSFGYVQQQRPNQNSTSSFSSTSHETCTRRYCSRFDCYCPCRWFCPCSPGIFCLVSQQCRRLHAEYLSRGPSYLSFSLLSTDPTTVPLASTNGNAASAATEPLASTPTAGAQPSNFPSAPLLPDSALFNRLLYTTILHFFLVPLTTAPLDQIAPTDTPEVQQWIQEVQATGINIPTSNATIEGRSDITFFPIGD